ncbi:hypothetical protein D6745_02245 [Candidatus Woesearchaeota archaeon]|nr:MAG: hypothetical protein D6745_02245 [Candidatus Woesearchaeota archaeon]
MKERVTLTIEKSLLDRVDKRIDRHRIKNRSHAVELLLSKALSENSPGKAVILAGGQGTRLRPITYEIPKALIPIQGKTMTEHLFDLFKKYGVRDIYLSVGYLKDKIIQAYGDGSRFGISIRYIKEEEALGTAGPLKLVKDELSSTFFVSNGDELKNINLEEMWEFHKKNKALATIALTTVEDPSAYGVARLNGSKIMEFVEKPKKSEAPSNLINAGLYLFEPEVIGMVKDGFCMLEKDVFPKLARKGQLFGYPFSGQWFDTGNNDRYARAIREWKGIK